MESKNNEKKVLALSFLGVLTFIAVVVGATYAYFAAQGGTAGNINVNAQTATTDNLSFQVGSAISLTANQEDFYQGADNKSGSTFARATLTANNATNNATRNYYIYLDITSNNFEYTTGDNQAELLLKVTDPDGTEVANISGLTRKTSGSGDNQVTGFDITTSTGLITIADNYEITSTGTVTQEWQIEVIFVNLDSDQNANTGKTFNANLIIQEEPMTTSLGNFAEYITQTLYTGTDGDNDLYYHDDDLANGAGDYSYRFTGANPNNYVCFGATGTDCQETENLYRIIGVFDGQIKLIKNNNINGNYEYVWAEEYNDWDESTKPSIYTTLNETFYNTLGSEWQNLIAETTWQVGGFSVLGNPKETYDDEVGINQTGYKETMKIGLMYVSDYAFAVSPEKWTITVDTDNYGAGTWLNYIHKNIEWTISPVNGSLVNSYAVDTAFDDGSITRLDVSAPDIIRPSFYLAPTVEFSGGTGTSSDPYRISL